MKKLTAEAFKPRVDISEGLVFQPNKIQGDNIDPEDQTMPGLVCHDEDNMMYYITYPDGGTGAGRYKSLEELFEAYSEDGIFLHVGFYAPRAAKKD